MPHKHAHLMMLYAQDAAVYDCPEAHWEWSHDEKRWYDFGRDEVPIWDLHTFYRRKPRTIKIGDIEVPEPMRVAPKNGTEYYVVDLANPDLFVRYLWNEDNYDVFFLRLGLCHLTKEAAITHAKALIAASGGEV